jgi:LPXTG-motif cell wall-anchored protein
MIIGLMAACALVGTSALASAQTHRDVTPPTYGPNTQLCTDSAPDVEVCGISVTRQDELPFTGSSSNTGLYAGIGVAVLLAGAALVVVTSRRRLAPARR